MTERYFTIGTTKAFEIFIIFQPRLRQLKSPPHYFIPFGSKIELRKLYPIRLQLSRLIQGAQRFSKRRVQKLAEST